MRPGARLGDIGAAIQSHAERHRYGVVRDFCGHGLGRLFHDAPEVVHAARAGSGPELKPGMFLTIEPMINLGRAHVKLLNDGWTAVTRDKSLSAQFEHSIGITEDGLRDFHQVPHRAGPASLFGGVVKPLSALLGLAALAGCQTAPAPAAVASENEERGHRLAQAACSQCHSIEAFDVSPGGAAPNWTDIANTPGLTRETLTTWLTDAHNYPGEMDFYLEPDEVGQLVDYMLTLRRENYHPPYQ